MINTNSGSDNVLNLSAQDNEKGIRTAPENMGSAARVRHEKKPTSDVQNPTGTLKYTGSGPTDASVNNKQDGSMQLPTISGGNKGTFITPSNNVEDNTAIDELI